MCSCRDPHAGDRNARRWGRHRHAHSDTHAYRDAYPDCHSDCDWDPGVASPDVHTDADLYIYPSPTDGNAHPADGNACSADGDVYPFPRTSDADADVYAISCAAPHRRLAGGIF